jgi:hypothetical protein
VLPLRRDNPAIQSAANSIDLRRRFNRPTNLASGQAVRLSIESLMAGSQVELNGQPLNDPSHCTRDDGETLSVDISQRLQPFNELRIEVRIGGAMAGGNDILLRSVALEIEMDD